MKPLSPVQQKFILHWGKIGTRWGVNRTVAQIHALFFISEKPLTAEEITETLDVARSNVSNILRKPQGWGIVKLVHVMGDKRDHFLRDDDVLVRSGAELADGGAAAIFEAWRQGAQDSGYWRLVKFFTQGVL
jgi:DNA-binding transcriptional regulator GbsR (MarR family)